MSSQRSERAWIPAAVASVALVVGLLGVWAVNKAAGGSLAPDADAPLWRWLVGTDNQFFGSDPFSGSGRLLVGTVVAVVVLLVVGFLGTWWAVRGLRPGSALLPVFLSTWMVLVVAAVVAAFVRFVVASPDQSFRGVGQVEHAVLTGGAIAGLRIGWVAALLAVLAWLIVRPGADASPDLVAVDPYDDPEERTREFVMKRRSDFNLEDHDSARRNAETYGRREGDRPEPQPEPYVGRRSSGRYAEDDEESPAPPDTSGGSHRG